MNNPTQLAAAARHLLQKFPLRLGIPNRDYLPMALLQELNQSGFLPA
jgi:hypothetical protein